MQIKSLIKKIATLLFLVTVLILPSFIFLNSTAVNAEDTQNLGIDRQRDSLGVLNNVAGQSGFVEKDPLLIISSVISTALGVVGILFLILMIYGGFLWMTDRGNEAQVKKAQKLIEAAIIGIIIIVSAYAITQFINNVLIQKSL